VGKESRQAENIQVDVEVKKSETPEVRKVDVPEGLWMKCDKCGEMLYRKEFEENLHCCTKCNKHYRVDARTRVEQLVDPGTFEELLSDITSTDPLEFKDRISYKDRLVQMEKKTGAKEAMIMGKCYIKGRPLVLGVMDPFFIMGSMGSVVGEKVTAAAELACEEDLPFIMVTASGGARMMEGMVSLVQMAKTSAALARLDDNGGLYVVVMTDPTTAGVAASFAFLGDLIIAEPATMIGFAGPRVIWNTVKAELPEGFQTAEFMLEHGFIDRIVDRHDLRNEIARIIDYCGK
jgi:acetyl-CoA carboxylase carboxyl transferase subunit beta